MDLEEMLDIRAAIVAILLSGIFIVMVWKVPTWEDYPFRSKLLITILLPVISYFIVFFAANKE